MAKIVYEPKEEKLQTESLQDLINLGESKGYISLDADRTKITYNATGKTYKYTDPEEPFRAAAYVELIEKYKYAEKRLDTEITAPRQEPKLPADIVVYEKGRDQVYITVEIKDEEAEKEIQTAKREGLGNANLFQSPYLWVVCGAEKMAYELGSRPPLLELEKHRIADIPISYGKEPKYKYKKGDPQWDLRPASFDELANKFQICHDDIWEGGKRDPAIAFDEMSKFMFAKIFDERFTKRGEYYSFQVGTHEEPKDVAKRVKECYKQAQAKEPSVFKVDIELPDRILFRMVEILQDLSFTGTDLDAKGRAFEKFLEKLFRGQYGQYFTRREIVEFMVDMLDPSEDDTVIDPACGSGGFLLYCIERVREQAKRDYDDDPTYHDIYKGFPRDQVFGIEINDRITRIAMMDMVIHDDGHTNIENGDSLDDFSKFSPKRDIRPVKYSLLLTNPPFGADVRNEEVLKQYELGSKIKARKTQRTEILFIERCLEFLQPLGRMAIVLPDGILTNSSLQYVRDFIERKAQILAVVSLPQGAFAPAGAGVKASLLFLQKKKKDGDDLGNYPIFMAIADHIGYDATGRPDANDLPKILGEYKQFLKGKREFNPAYVVQKNDLEARWDVIFYTPVFLEASKTIKRTKWPLKRLNDIAVSVKDGPGGWDFHVSDYVKSGIPMLRVLNLREDRIDLTEVVFISERTHKKLRRSEVKPGDVLLSMRGTIGISTVCPSSISSANINAAICRIRLKPEINPKYISAFFNTSVGRLQSQRHGFKAVQHDLNLAIIKDFNVPVPPREVQDKIASLMNLAYKQRRQKLTQAQQLLGSIEPYLLDKLGIKIVEVGEKTKFVTSYNDLESRFDPFFYKPKYIALDTALKRGHYQVKPIGDLILRTSGGATPKAKSEAYCDATSGVPFLRIQNIGQGYIDLADVKYIRPEVHKGLLRRSQLKPGDLLFTITGRIGTAAVVPRGFGEANINQHMVKMELKEGVYPYYVEAVLNALIGKVQGERKTTGTTRIALDYPSIKSIRVPVPPLSVQTQIAREVQKRRTEAKKLQDEAEDIVNVAKVKVEQIILGK